MLYYTFCKFSKRTDLISKDVIIIGAGAAGLMCAIEAGKRGRRVLVLEKSNKVGKKILMSGGGRCNFTNYYIEADKYLSHNPHFCKSALSRYSQWDFIALVERYGIPYYEKILGQLFCQNKASDITEMLIKEATRYQVEIYLQQRIDTVSQNDGGFLIHTDQGLFQCDSLVVATGGLSIPTLGSSPFGYQIAKQFGLDVYPTRAALVPFTLHLEDKNRFSELSGVSVDCHVVCNGQSFREMMLFTHRGLSGPAMLQISTYWNPGDVLVINLIPDIDLMLILKTEQNQRPDVLLKTVLAQFLPKRLLSLLFNEVQITMSLKQLNLTTLQYIVDHLQQWQIKPNATEGYRTAEVTLGGVNCDEVSSKTFECHKVPHLYFVGEVLDVTGWLGGYNFQWAWSSGWAAGQVV